MKKLYRFSAIALCVLPLFFTSCSDYLDRDDDDNITEADVFARYEKVNGLVSDVYAAAKKADRPLVFFEHFSNSAITDECEGTNVEGNITNNFNNGAWNPNSLPGSVGQYWEALYEGIRKANLLPTRSVKAQERNPSKHRVGSRPRPCTGCQDNRQDSQRWYQKVFNFGIDITF